MEKADFSFLFCRNNVEGSLKQRRDARQAKGHVNVLISTRMRAERWFGK